MYGGFRNVKMLCRCTYGFFRFEYVFPFDDRTLGYIISHTCTSGYRNYMQNYVVI